MTYEDLDPLFLHLIMFFMIGEMDIKIFMYNKTWDLLYTHTHAHTHTHTRTHTMGSKKKNLIFIFLQVDRNIIKKKRKSKSAN